MLETDYPYASAVSGLTGTTCNFDSTKTIQKVEATTYSTTGWIPASSAYTALASNGPINIYVWVCNEFRYYKSGYFAADSLPSTCQPSGGSINHSVMLVGHETKPASTTSTKTCTRATRTDIRKKTCAAGTGTFQAATNTSVALCCITKTITLQPV